MEMMAMESFNTTPETLAEIQARVQSTGVVSRQDVEPYIKHFPITVGLNNFSEEPSAQNVHMALEGFAALYTASVNKGHVGSIERSLKNIEQSIPDFSTAQANLSEARSDAEFVERKGHLLMLALSSDKMGELEPALLRSVVTDGIIPDGDGRVNFEAAITPIRNLFEAELQANCNGVTTAALTNKSLLAGAVYQDVREIAADLTMRVNKVNALLGQADEFIARDEIAELSIAIMSHVTSPRRQKAIGRIDSNYDSVLAPIGSMGDAFEGGLDDSKVLASKLDGLVTHVDGLKEEPFEVTRLTGTSEALVNAYQSGQLMGGIKTKTKGIIIDLNDFNPLRDALLKLGERSPETMLPEGADQALTTFLRSVEVDTGSLLVLAKLFQSEMIHLATYVDLYATAQHKIVDILAMFIKHGKDVSPEHREKFFALLKKMDSPDVVMATEAVGAILKLVGLGTILALVGAAALTLRKLINRKIPVMQKKTAQAVDGFGRAASNIVKELKGGKYGSETYRLLKEKIDATNNAPVMEAYDQGSIMYGKENTIQGNAVLVQDYLTGNYHPLLDQAAKPYIALVGDIADFFDNNITKDINALAKNANTSVDELQTPRRYPGSYYKASGLQRAVERWASSNHLSAEDIAAFGEAWRTKYLAQASGDKANQGDIHLDTVISENAAEEVNVAKRKLGNTADNLERTVKKLDSGEEVNKAAIAKLREVMAQIKEDIAVLNVIGDILEKEVEHANHAITFKGKHTNMVLKAIENAANEVLSDGNADQASNDGLNSLRGHIKEVVGETKTAMGIFKK